MKFHYPAYHFCTIEESIVVDFSHELKIFGSHLIQTTRFQYPCIADESIDATKISNSKMNQIFDARDISHIGFYKDGAVAFSQGDEFLHSCQSNRFVHVGHHNISTFLQQATGNAFAKALGGACNNNGFIFGPTGSCTGSH